VEEQKNDVETQSCAVLISIYLRLSKNGVNFFISSWVFSCTSGPRNDVKVERGPQVSKACRLQATDTTSPYFSLFLVAMELLVTMSTSPTLSSRL